MAHDLCTPAEDTWEGALWNFIPQTKSLFWQILAQSGHSIDLVSRLIISFHEAPGQLMKTKSPVLVFFISHGFALYLKMKCFLLPQEILKTTSTRLRKLSYKEFLFLEFFDRTHSIWKPVWGIGDSQFFFFVRKCTGPEGTLFRANNIMLVLPFIATRIGTVHNAVCRQDKERVLREARGTSKRVC